MLSPLSLEEVCLRDITLFLLTNTLCNLRYTIMTKRDLGFSVTGSRDYGWYILLRLIATKYSDTTLIPGAFHPMESKAERLSCGKGRSHHQRVQRCFVGTGGDRVVDIGKSQPAKLVKWTQQCLLFFNSAYSSTAARRNQYLSTPVIFPV